MKLGYTILYVDNVAKSLAFYEAALGFNTRFFHSESGEYGELDTGSTVLAFCARSMLIKQGKTPQVPDAQTPCFEMAFVTEDVPASLARAIQAGATLQQNPEAMPWGQTIAYVSDIDGFLIELCTPVSIP